LTRAKKARSVKPGNPLNQKEIRKEFRPTQKGGPNSDPLRKKKNFNWGGKGKRKERPMKSKTHHTHTRLKLRRKEKKKKKREGKGPGPGRRTARWKIVASHENKWRREKPSKKLTGTRNRAKPQKVENNQAVPRKTNQGSLLQSDLERSRQSNWTAKTGPEDVGGKKVAVELKPWRSENAQSGSRSRGGKKKKTSV